MELDTSLRKVFCCGVSEEKKAVVPVDCSIVLPDYFPDVMKILRYTAKTVKSPVFSEGGAEVVSGSVNIEVNYVSEEGELCSCSQLQPFSHSFEIGKNVSAAEAEISVGEMGCRAVNKRRIDLHGSIEILLRVLCGEEKNVLSSVSGAGAVFKKEETETVLMVGEFFKNFTVDEKGELGYGKPPFGRVIRSSAMGEVTECHVIQDKIVTKGEIRVNVLWSAEANPENGESGIFLSSFSFPVSRMVDAEGILLTDICDARYEAEFPEIIPSEDGSCIGIKVKVGIFARVYRKEKTEFISDMFSTEFETKPEKTKLLVINEALPISVSEQIFEKFDLPEGIEDVTDIWVETKNPKVSGEGKIELCSKLCMFAKDGEGAPLYFEKEIEKEIKSPAEGKNIVFHNLFSGIRSEDFSFGRDGKAEISAAVIIDGT
ncbi:MAG: DUF3794 domain-containing protein, partial [Oscillospiraceae bacterium]|nr:DUF3794 domain-containing protein [Oscillospiraceae bacterium]